MQMKQMFKFIVVGALIEEIALFEVVSCMLLN